MPLWPTQAPAPALDVDALLRPSELERDLLDLVGVHDALGTPWSEAEASLRRLTGLRSAEQIGEVLLQLAADVLSASSTVARTFCLSQALTSLSQDGVLQADHLRVVRVVLQTALLASAGIDVPLTRPGAVAHSVWLRATYVVLRVAHLRLQKLHTASLSDPRGLCREVHVCASGCAVRAGRCGWSGCQGLGSRADGRCGRAGHDGPEPEPRAVVVSCSRRIRMLLPFPAKAVTRRAGTPRGHITQVSWHGGPSEADVATLLRGRGLPLANVLLTRVEHDLVTQTATALALVSAGLLRGSEAAAWRRLDFALLATPPEPPGHPHTRAHGDDAIVHASRLFWSGHWRQYTSRSLAVLRYLRAAADLSSEEFGIYVLALPTAVDEAAAASSARALCTGPAVAA